MSSALASGFFTTAPPGKPANAFSCLNYPTFKNSELSHGNNTSGGSNNNNSAYYLSSIILSPLHILTDIIKGTTEDEMKVKQESEKVGLKFNIQKTNIMASGPITPWKIDGEIVGTVADIFLGSKITADGDCTHEIKRCLLLGRKVMTNLDSVLKSRDITLSIKVCLDKAMVFPVVMCRCDSWTIKKAEH